MYGEFTLLLPSNSLTASQYPGFTGQDSDTSDVDPTIHFVYAVNEVFEGLLELETRDGLFSFHVYSSSIGSQAWPTTSILMARPLVEEKTPNQGLVPPSLTPLCIVSNS